MDFDYGPAADDHLAQPNNLLLDDDDAEDQSYEEGDGTGGTEERPEASTRRHKSGKRKDKKDRKMSKKHKKDKEGRRLRKRADTGEDHTELGDEIG